MAFYKGYQVREHNGKFYIIDKNFNVVSYNGTTLWNERKTAVGLARAFNSE